ILAPYGTVITKPFTEMTQSYDVIINSTSASLDGELPAIDPVIFSPHSVCYDMMYGKGHPVFNQWALQQGCAQVIDGLGMLVGQAAESFMLWRGLRPGTKQILRELRKNLERAL
ncbi:shikimate dehydrogenase, partial [Vibrio cholerae]|nr:shikimate dehydrogenase [Vibrio cholerae]